MNASVKLPIESVVMNVRRMQPADAARWDAFVQACPEASFFHRAGWAEVIERAFGHRTHFLLAEADGEIQGVLPLAEINSRLFGHSLSALPFCVYGGPAASCQEAKSALDLAAQKLAVELRVEHLEYRNRIPFHTDWPGKDLYVTRKWNGI
jgi:CelD/BcsL family acetyltransferase involved in cellulose biosynthesis